MSKCRLFDILQQTFAADTHPSGTDEAAGAPYSKPKLTLMPSDLGF
jgi:hypothetical protein